MKGKATWKPVGLCAKKWRNPAQLKSSATSLPPSKPLRKKALRRNAGGGWPFYNEKP